MLHDLKINAMNHFFLNWGHFWSSVSNFLMKKLPYESIWVKIYGVWHQFNCMPEEIFTPYMLSVVNPWYIWHFWPSYDLFKVNMVEHYTHNGKMEWYLIMKHHACAWHLQVNKFQWPSDQLYSSDLRPRPEIVTSTVQWWKEHLMQCKMIFWTSKYKNEEINLLLPDWCLSVFVIPRSWNAGFLNL